jgi:hypothetical protein
VLGSCGISTAFIIHECVVHLEAALLFLGEDDA